MKKKEKINILHLVNGFAIGGGELKLLELLQHLNKQRYHVIVCSVGQGGPLHEEFQKVAAKVYVFPKKHRFDFTLVFKVARLMKHEKIDIVQTTLFYADVIGALAAKLAKLPYVISWEVVTQPFKKIHKYAYALAKRNINLVVTVSDAINKKMLEERKLMKTRVKTIHYGVDLTKFQSNGVMDSSGRANFGFSEDDLLVGVVARLTEQKGHKYLVQSAPSVIKKFPNVRFVFVGDGPLSRNIETQIDSLNLSSNFRFLGFRDDVQQLLKLFDVFALPSLYEGLPNVVLEAMACGKPVVATAVDGTPEAVEDGVTGILVPPKDSKALEHALIEIFSDKEKLVLMGKQGRQRVEDFFSLEKQVKSFERLYDDFASFK